MSGTSDAEKRIQARMSQGHFLANLLYVATTESEDVQSHFVKNVSDLRRKVRDILERRGLIRKVTYDPRVFWPAQTGLAYGFIDGGVANIEIPSSAPIGIRVGSYVVRPGDPAASREEFNIELALMDELFGATSGLYSPDESEDPFADVMKLRDAARILFETAGALRLAARPSDRPDAILVHGPLINPVAPYGLEKFPPLQEEAARRVLNDPTWSGDKGQRGFVRLELELLIRLRETRVPVVGIVERAKVGAHTFFAALLRNLQDAANDALKEKHVDELLELAKTFGLNDTAIFDLVLEEGEFVVPVPVDRQQPESKWPKHGNLHHWIGNYPRALTTFVKPSEQAQPLRLEGFEGMPDFDRVLALTVHTSRLLPSYVFPVGLDIVDRFSKVPAWLSAGVRSRHQIALLRQAFQSNDPRVVSYAKRVLASRGRDWLFRPDM